MEKIIFITDSFTTDSNAVRFACFLTRLTHSRLTGLFLERDLAEPQIVVDHAALSDTTTITVLNPVTEDEKIEIESENIRLFRSITGQEGVQASVYVNRGEPALDIIAESRFADLLIVDPATSLALFSEEVPTRLVKAILQQAECPVIITPEQFNGIDNIVFCYDGSKSSVFAIKQFTYLFPELKDKRAKVIDMNGLNDFVDEDRQAITSWLQYHYTDIDFVAGEEGTTEAFFNYLLKKKNDLVVMGAYGKGLLASFFTEGQAGKETRTTSLPIFIAHY